MLYQFITPYLSMKDFHGEYNCKTEKKTLPIPPNGFSMKVSRYRDCIIDPKMIYTNVYLTGSGIVTGFPFGLYIYRN